MIFPFAWVGMLEKLLLTLFISGMLPNTFLSISFEFGDSSHNIKEKLLENLYHMCVLIGKDCISLN